MNTSEYKAETTNNPISHLPPKYNKSTMPVINIANNNIDDSTGSFDFAILLQQIFSKLIDNQTNYDLLSGPSSPSSDEKPYYFLSAISLWFVLLVNPILIIFGVIGNLCAIYILIRCNIVKLPVSFYTIMLNISDTLNLLIPVLIFWLDNCFNRTPEHGYFRDKSNFLCKILMCPDQFFSALSAWYMCAISFNRWYSIWRPSSFFSQQTFQTVRLDSSSMNNSIINENNSNQRKQSSASMILPSLSSCSCVTEKIKHRQLLKAFRSIGLITLLGILFCLYPIFMHELRPVMPTNQQFFDSTHNLPHAVVWKRCYYSRKYEHIYDVIGIMLSCLLHVLPLTFIAVMNFMIILRLRQRRHGFSNVTHLSALIRKERMRLNNARKNLSLLPRQDEDNLSNKSPSPPPQAKTTYKDQSTSTDLPARSQIKVKKPHTPKRHHARDRTITIMLVTIALSYLILTIPYRLFWLYNVYIKRMYPEKLNSSIYLLNMHYIDHVFRTIRNIHYGTNFLFFIFLSKTFRRKVQRLFREKFSRTQTELLQKNIIQKRQSKECQENLEKTKRHTLNQISGPLNDALM